MVINLKAKYAVNLKSRLIRRHCMHKKLMFQLEYFSIAKYYDKT